jgi:cytochrome c peroxidase
MLTVASKIGRITRAALAAVAVIAGGIAAGTRAPPRMRHNPPTPSASDAAVAAVGREIFFDTTLSTSGRMSCATCHSPTHAYGPPNALAVQLGGPALNRQGARSRGEVVTPPARHGAIATSCDGA